MNTRRSSRLASRSHALRGSELRSACGVCARRARFATSIASDPQAKSASRQNVARWPKVSIASPATVGPAKFEMAKPSASQPKLSRRVSWVLISPTMCCTQMWKSMKPVPTPAAAK